MTSWLRSAVGPRVATTQEPRKNAVMDERPADLGTGTGHLAHTREEGAHGGAASGVSRHSWAPVIGAFLIPAILITLTVVANLSR